MRLEELLKVIGAECPEHIRDTEIREIVTDSQRAVGGCMFIAIKGYNTDGHDHISDAVKNGAVVIVAERVCDECVGGAAIIKANNTRRVASLLYNEQCKRPSERIKVVGVTGTNGKTSVCTALESIFLFAGISCAVIGTLGARINGKPLRCGYGGLTTPEPAELYPLLALFAKRGVEYVFMEVSSHALALERVAGVSFEYGVFTNLTRDHLDLHGDMESYFQAKASLFERCRRSVINIDSPYGKRLGETYGGTFASFRGKGDFNAEEITVTRKGVGYTLCTSDRRIPIVTSALGEFSVMNSMQAAAVALLENVSEDAVMGGLSLFCGAKGRLERITDASLDPFDVIIDYAHTPDALEQTLLSLYPQRKEGERIILVFGCGGDRDRGKRRQMARIASRLADVTVVTSDNPRGESPQEIADEILRGIDKERPYACILSRRDAIIYALEYAREGDTVLLCGKGHEKYSIDAEGKHPFDEEAIVKEWLSRQKTEI